MLETIAVEGHDASGKSTLSQLLADALGGVRVRPFSDTLGDHIAWLWRTEQFDAAHQLARSSVRRVRETTEGRPLVFDRHWLTMFTVLPERLRDEWRPLPPTILLTAPTPVVVARLRERGEPVGSEAKHTEYTRLYNELVTLAPAHLVVETHLVDEAATLDAAVSFCRSLDRGAPVAAGVEGRDA